MQSCIHPGGERGRERGRERERQTDSTKRDREIWRNKEGLDREREGRKVVRTQQWR
jgi:hypothetical protein